MTSEAVSARQSSERVTIWFLGLLTAYFAAQTLLRIFTATSLSLDEAEMLVVTQGLAWGYGASQPPLYGWLMLGAFKLFGIGVPALAITKNLLLWATFVLTFLWGRVVLGSDLKAALASAALVSVPQIGWKAQFDLTHSVLALTMAALTFTVFLELLKNGRWRDYAALGLCFALGTLSKYNYALFAAALLTAAAMIPPFRQRILSARMLLSLGLCLILLAPHLHWIWSHPTLALSRVTKLGIAEDLSILSASGEALLGFARAMISCALLPAALMLVIAFLPSRRNASPMPELETGWPEAKRLVLNTLAVSLVFALVLVVGSRSTTLRDHWFMPLLLLFPMGLLILLEPRFTALRVQALALACGGLSLAALGGLAVTHFFPDLVNRPPRSSAPYGAVAGAIRNLGFSDGYILADTSYAAGNLKLRFPGSSVAEVEYGFPHPPAGAPARPLLIVWGAQAEPPAKLRTLWTAFCATTETSPAVTRVSAPYEHSRVVYTLHVVLQPRCAPKAE